MSPAPTAAWHMCRQRARRSRQPVVSNRRGPLSSSAPSWPMRRVIGYAMTASGIVFELGEQTLEPTRMPAIVIAHPREVLGGRTLAPGDLRNVAPGRDHRLTAVVTEIPDARIPRRISARHRLGLIRRGIVEEDEREVAVRLREQRLDRLGQVTRVVVERHAEDDAAASRRARRFGTRRPGRSETDRPYGRDPTVRRDAGS